MTKKETMIKELEEWINRNSLDAMTNTPDYILAEMIMDVLVAYNNARRKERNYAKDEGKTVKLYCGSCKHFEVDSRFSTDWCKEHQESKNSYSQACNDFWGKDTVQEECMQCACLD